jgi:hypothetical protein
MRKKIDFIHGRPGVSNSVLHEQLVAGKDWEFGHPTNIIAEDECVTLLRFTTMYPNAATSGHYVSLLDNTATQANSASGGIAVTTNASPSDNDDMALGGTRTLLMAANQLWLFKGRAMVNSAANMGITAGFDSSASSAEIFTANPTDGVFLIKPKNSANLTLRVVENGNAAVDLSVFNLTSG